MASLSVCLSVCVSCELTCLADDLRELVVPGAVQGPPEPQEHRRGLAREHQGVRAQSQHVVAEPGGGAIGPAGLAGVAEP